MTMSNVGTGGSGRPVPLMSHEGENFKVNENAFDDILRQDDLLDRKLVVISIVGEYRRGKSFFLNYVMRYLTNQDKTDWFDDAKDSRLSGFNWRRGSERETEGIVMWSQAFPLGSEYAVILLDTEGTYDEKSTNKTMFRIVGCNALISSLQIFNVPQKITKQTMQEFQAFAEFGRLADSSDCESQEAVYQNLIFLVRDWIYKEEREFGIDGGQEHLDHWLESDSDGIKDTMTTCYDKVSCYLMPSPGDKVIRDPQFDGSTSEMAPDFAIHLKKVIELVFTPEFLQPRKIKGKTLQLKDFMEYFLSFDKSLNDADVEPTSLFQSQVQICNSEAKQAAIEYYTQIMNELTTHEEPRDDLPQLHDDTVKKALTIFENYPKIGGERYATTYRNILLLDLQICHSKYLNTDTRKRVRKSEILEEEKLRWEYENKRLMDELQRKQDLETEALKALALKEKLIEVELLAQAEEYKQRLHNLEQKAAADRMQMQHEFQLKLLEMQQEQRSYEEMKEEMHRQAQHFDKTQQTFKRNAEVVLNEQKNKNSVFMAILEGTALVLNAPIVHELFKTLRSFFSKN